MCSPGVRSKRKILVLALEAALLHIICRASPDRPSERGSNKPPMTIGVAEAVTLPQCDNRAADGRTSPPGSAWTGMPSALARRRDSAFSIAMRFHAALADGGTGSADAFRWVADHHQPIRLSAAMRRITPINYALPLYSDADQPKSIDLTRKGSRAASQCEILDLAIFAMVPRGCQHMNMGCAG